MPPILNPALRLPRSVATPAAVGGTAGEQLFTTDALKLRAAPGLIGTRLGVFPKGTLLTVVPSPSGRTREGEWLHVRGTLPGSPPAVSTGWVHSGYTRVGAPPAAPAALTSAAGNGQQRGVGGGAIKFIGGNYTDLGMVNGVYDPAQTVDDLQRLRGKGVEEVRVWAGNLPGLDLNRPADLANRIAHIGQVAKSLGMTVTVDLFDGATMGGLQVSQYRAMDAQLNGLIDTIVGRNAGQSNIRWSIGNEIADPAHPAELADWFVEKAARVRRAGGPGTLVIAELLPGSVNHPFAAAPYEAAARRIIKAADVVSIHFYPEGGYPAATGSLEYQSVRKWNDLSRELGKPLVIGEFNVGPDHRTDEALRSWLIHFHEIGVDEVRFWQFLKNEGGHLDPFSMDSFTGRDHLGAVSPWLGINPKNDGL